MHGGRWYPTLVTLADGRVLAMSGHPEKTAIVHNNAEMETFAPSAWTSLGDSPDVADFDSPDPRYLYPRLFVGPTGDVFSATPLGKQFAGDPGRSGSWNRSGVTWKRSAAPPQGIPWGAYGDYTAPAVLLPLLEDEEPARSFRFKVLFAGLGTAWITDLGTPSDPVPQPRWEVKGQARPQRLNSHLVVLASGEVLLTGGVQNMLQDPPDDSSVLAPQLFVFNGTDWDWATTPLSHAKVPRNYHSTALLMPDGRVFTGGSNVNSNRGYETDKPAVRRLELEIYSPWYACADRPRIISAPPSVKQGQRLFVEVRGPHPITRLALVRAGSSTHAFNSDQRYIGLIARPGGQLNPGRYAAPIPEQAVAVPGYYLVFACTAQHVPSKGVFVRVDPG